MYSYATGSFRTMKMQIPEKNEKNVNYYDPFEAKFLLKNVNVNFYMKSVAHLQPHQVNQSSENNLNTDTRTNAKTSG